MRSRLEPGHDRAIRWAQWLTGLGGRLYRTGWPARLGRALGMPLQPRATQYAVALPARILPGPLRLALASDFHVGPTTHPALVAAGCAALRDAQPDVVLLGGDFVEADASAMHALVPLLRDVPAPLGRFAVLGNHDWWTSPQRILDGLTDAGVDVLINRNARLPPPFEGGVPLVVAEGPLSRRYSRGRYDLEGGASRIVSVGIGCSLLPFRAFSHPEIVLCELTGGG